MVVRIAVGALLGACIGYERMRHGNPLGLRTHMLVALGAATFMVVSSQFVFHQGYDPSLGGKLIQIDTSRIASLVVSGIGFLAGGAIMRAGGHIQNLTSAAGLWLVTATGMAAGAGMYVEASAATALGVFALVIVRRVEDKSEFPVRGQLRTQRARVEALCEKLERAGMVVFAIEHATEGTSTIRFEHKKRLTTSLLAIVRELQAEPGVEALSVERAA